MKVKYQFHDINKKGMVYGVGDLMKYYADISVRLREKMEMLKKEKRIRDTLTNYLRKKTGAVGITVNSVFNAVEEVLEQGDMFYFTVDGEKFCDFIRDKDTIDMEIYIDNNYFLTQMMVSKFIPISFGGFRKKYPEGIEGEKQKWIDWFEGEWKKDLKFKGFSNPKFNKTILEE